MPGVITARRFLHDAEKPHVTERGGRARESHRGVERKRRDEDDVAFSCITSRWADPSETTASAKDVGWPSRSAASSGSASISSSMSRASRAVWKRASSLRAISLRVNASRTHGTATPLARFAIGGGSFEMFAIAISIALPTNGVRPANIS